MIATILDDKSRLSLKSYLQQVPIFNRLSGEEVELILDESTVGEFDSADRFRLFHDHSDYGILVLEGRVGLYSLLPHGKELIVELLFDGDWYGLVPSPSAHLSPLSFRSQIPSKIMFIPHAAIREAARNYHHTCEALMTGMQHQLNVALSLAGMLAHEDIETRLASVLLKLTSRIGVNRPVRHCREVAISRRELADMVGTSVETAIRITKQWEREGTIAVNCPGKLCVRDQDALRKICSEIIV